MVRDSGLIGQDSDLRPVVRAFWAGSPGSGHVAVRRHNADLDPFPPPGVYCETPRVVMVMHDEDASMGPRSICTSPNA